MGEGARRARRKGYLKQVEGKRAQISPTIAYGPLLPTPHGPLAQSNASNLSIRGSGPVATVLLVRQQPKASCSHHLSGEKRKAVSGRTSGSRRALTRPEPAVKTNWSFSPPCFYTGRVMHWPRELTLGSRAEPSNLFFLQG